MSYSRVNKVLRQAFFSCALLVFCCLSARGDNFVIPQSYQGVIDGKYRQNFQRVTGYEFSGLHWDQWIAVFLNKDFSVYRNNYLAYLQKYMQDDDEDEDEKSNTMPFQRYSVGTVVLKEHYQDKENLPQTGLTTAVMIKREQGYDPAGGDWEYLQASKEGEVIISGNSSNASIVSLCQDCHANVAERDYIFSTYFSGK